MIYKFFSHGTDEDVFLELSAKSENLLIETGSMNDLDYGMKFEIRSSEIDNMIKALQNVKNDISGNTTDTFEIIKRNN